MILRREVLLLVGVLRDKTGAIQAGLVIHFNNLERSAKTAAIATIFNMSQDRQTTSGTSSRIREHVSVHHRAFTNELTPKSNANDAVTSKPICFSITGAIKRGLNH
jgi:hypothetical protein